MFKGINDSFSMPGWKKQLIPKVDASEIFGYCGLSFIEEYCVTDCNLLNSKMNIDLLCFLKLRIKIKSCVRVAGICWCKLLIFTNASFETNLISCTLKSFFSRNDHQLSRLRVVFILLMNAVLWQSGLKQFLTRNAEKASYFRFNEKQSELIF